LRVGTRGVFGWTLSIAGVVTALGLIGSQANPLTFVMLVLLIPPHLALVIAWVVWGRSPSKFESRRAGTALLSGLFACSLNITIFWMRGIWMNARRTDPSVWSQFDKFAVPGGVLLAYALVAGVVGEGRGQLALLIAAVTGWLIWITGGIGIL